MFPKKFFLYVPEKIFLPFTKKLTAGCYLISYLTSDRSIPSFSEI